MIMTRHRLYPWPPVQRCQKDTVCLLCPTDKTLKVLRLIWIHGINNKINDENLKIENPPKIHL